MTRGDNRLQASVLVKIFAVLKRKYLLYAGMFHAAKPQEVRLVVEINIQIARSCFAAEETRSLRARKNSVGRCSSLGSRFDASAHSLLDPLSSHLASLLLPLKQSSFSIP